ncbi:MAG: hypothetical protein AMK71_03780 [Nitrospira bacterium SG8_35_4]|nr:MAG: hypothetical protein AMK71_03780 [Nitrospira bacterium SG8_35_4]
MEPENPKIEWLMKSGKNYLKFTFKGSLSKEMASVAIKKWRDAFHLKAEEKITLVWDCLEMEGYDTESRKSWQNALKEMKDQIETIWLITTSNVIKMGASIMGAFSTLKIRTVSTESEIR